MGICTRIDFTGRTYLLGTGTVVLNHLARSIKFESITLNAIGRFFVEPGGWLLGRSKCREA